MFATTANGIKESFQAIISSKDDPIAAHSAAFSLPSILEYLSTQLDDDLVNPVIECNRIYD